MQFTIFNFFKKGVKNAVRLFEKRVSFQFAFILFYKMHLFLSTTHPSTPYMPLELTRHLRHQITQTSMPPTLPTLHTH